jgi:phage terminase large subunit
MAHVKFAPWGGARELFTAKEDEILMVGPAGTGKSVACLWRMHTACLLNPGMRGLMARRTMISLTSTALVTWREKVVKQALAEHVLWYYGGSKEEPAQYRYRNGSVIVIGGLDNPDKIMSSEYDLIYVQEAIELREDDWEKLTTRLRNNARDPMQLIADTNPGAPTHWLRGRVNRGVTKEILSRHEDNPTLMRRDGTLTPSGEKYLARLDRLTGVRYERLRKGKWVAAEGSIYDMWDDAIHLVDRFEVPIEWTRYWAIDFGFTNPFVCQWWAEDPDGRLILYREIYMTGRTVDEHAKTIMAQVSRANRNYVHPAGQQRYAHQGRDWIEPKPRAIICDHDAGGRVVLAREVGLSTVAAHKAVDTGIQAVQQRLQLADERPRLQLMRDCVVERDSTLEERKVPQCTYEEISGYVWDTSEGKPPKEVPDKEDDHGMDAERYMVAHLDLSTRPNIRFM